MLECFYPDQYLCSAYQIDYQSYYDMGYRGIIFDIDNTLVCHGNPADERTFKYGKQRHNGKYGLA